MKYEQMTKRQQLLSRNAVCPICDQVVTKFDDVQIVNIPYGRAVLHFYIHSKCLIKQIYPSQLEREVENEEITV